MSIRLYYILSIISVSLLSISFPKTVALFLTGPLWLSVLSSLLSSVAYILVVISIGFFWGNILRCFFLIENY